jgi:dihydrodipicolinate synthase/N-acetylneuraminate lyase
MARTLSGVLAIVHTPFTDDDQIDAAAFRKAVDWAFSVGADGLGMGMVSETFKLTRDERLALAAMLVECTAGRGPVFAAVGADSTKQALEYATAADKSGCDAVMAVPPLTARLSEAHLVDHFRALADAISIPVIVQDASGYIGQSIPIAACVKLLERYGPEKILFKPEAAPNGPTLSALRDATAGKARIFEGSGGIFLIDSFRRGIAGTMPGLELLDGVVAVWKALERGDEEAAYRAYFPICAIVALQMQAGLDGFLAVEKHLMVKRGLFPSARRRRPYGWDLDAETAAEVDRLFERM